MNGLVELVFWRHGRIGFGVVVELVFGIHMFVASWSNWFWRRGRICFWDSYVVVAVFGRIGFGVVVELVVGIDAVNSAKGAEGARLKSRRG